MSRFGATYLPPPWATLKSSTLYAAMEDILDLFFCLLGSIVLELREWFTNQKELDFANSF